MSQAKRDFDSAEESRIADETADFRANRLEPRFDNLLADLFPALREPAQPMSYEGLPKAPWESEKSERGSK